MARPKKQTVDYFPHQCTHGKTMFILEQKYGNDGYAFWFKLLEILGGSEGHYFQLENVADWEFLQAKTHLERNKCEEILCLLANLDAIDKELWDEARIVWSDNFLKNIAVVYTNRRAEIPTKPSFYIKKPERDRVSTGRNPQSRVKESRVEDSRVNNNPPIIPPKKSYAEYVTMTNDEYERLLATYGKEMTDGMIEILDNYKGANGKRYKSDYRAILNWVVKRYKEEHGRQTTPGRRIPRAYASLLEYAQEGENGQTGDFEVIDISGQ
jgi:hypothetical protein